MNNKEMIGKIVWFSLDVDEEQVEWGFISEVIREREVPFITITTFKNPLIIHPFAIFWKGEYWDYAVEQ